MDIKLPLIVLGYDEKRLFSVEDVKSNIILPIFTSAERADRYKNYFCQQHELDLNTLMVVEPERAVNLFEVVVLISSVKFAVIDPYPPTWGRQSEAIGVWDLVNQLKGLLLAPQKDDNQYHPQSHEGDAADFAE
jgi:hypothetical protein